WSTSKTPSYTKSVSWQHHQWCLLDKIGPKIQTIQKDTGYTSSIMRDVTQLVITFKNKHLTHKKAQIFFLRFLKKPYVILSVLN
ncbi:hypothetical protein, partial [Pantoea piersonii]|uniref:hypothetical protein n=1 Tax=Pantoea piersonii TaxID=2364647 RepID=UPI0028A9B7BF